MRILSDIKTGLHGAVDFIPPNFLSICFWAIKTIFAEDAESHDGIPSRLHFCEVPNQKSILSKA